ncbi:formyltransferase family protein [Flavobacterium sp.]|uniref:formyltransferase family protein n=1 Tax=Flavobacterium sp. TaxID=239 RepID=UPI00286E086D|nr:formyltransferase family protein [Flavobacterium sp.]
MGKYIILSEKVWHKNLFDNLKNSIEGNWSLIDTKENFNLKSLTEFNPSKIFIPHWSYIIPSEIYENFECIVFHMTDLPFGRGGSPLQNLIEKGFKTTKISAIKVEKGIDTGDVYLKKEMSLSGSAREIFENSSIIVEKMISEIITGDIKPVPQVGEVTEFKRRKPEESNLMNLSDIEKVYDYIRMLDCEGYPHAFIETSFFKIEFTDANFDSNTKTINANVRIFKK